MHKYYISKYVHSTWTSSTAPTLQTEIAYQHDRYTNGAAQFMNIYLKFEKYNAEL